ncbi:MAG: hypothetical protein PHY54_02630 [Methylococcales bacterium]|nr:hypothetical protein [Methylococcales bacterium]
MLNLTKTIVLSLFLFTNIASAGISESNNEDSRPFQLEPLPGQPASPESGAPDGVKDAPLVSFIDGSIVTSTQNATYWDLTSDFGTDASLLAYHNFQKGYNFSADRPHQTGSSQTTAVTDSSTHIQNNVAMLHANDVKPSQLASNSAMQAPLPTAVWFLLSSLIILLYVGRCKNVL